jgi:hypothetical protein
MSHDMDEQVDAVFPVQGQVYCATCHWYAPASWAVLREVVFPAQCRAPGACVTMRTWERVSVVRLRPCERNAHNDCPEWRRRSVLKTLRPLVSVGVLLALVGVVWKLCVRSWLAVPRVCRGGAIPPGGIGAC